MAHKYQYPAQAQGTGVAHLKQDPRILERVEYIGKIEHADPQQLVVIRAECKAKGHSSLVALIDKMTK